MAGGGVGRCGGVAGRPGTSAGSARWARWRRGVGVRDRGGSGGRRSWTPRHADRLRRAGRRPGPRPGRREDGRSAVVRARARWWPGPGRRAACRAADAARRQSGWADSFVLRPSGVRPVGSRPARLRPGWSRARRCRGAHGVRSPDAVPARRWSAMCPGIHASRVPLRWSPQISRCWSFRRRSGPVLPPRRWRRACGDTGLRCSWWCGGRRRVGSLPATSAGHWTFLCSLPCARSPAWPAHWTAV